MPHLSAAFQTFLRLFQFVDFRKIQFPLKKSSFLPYVCGIQDGAQHLRSIIEILYHLFTGLGYN